MPIQTVKFHHKITRKGSKSNHFTFTHLNSYRLALGEYFIVFGVTNFAVHLYICGTGTTGLESPTSL